MIEEDLKTKIVLPCSIREIVYKRISELILTGKLAPSERIMENKLSKQLGVSRTPIREALHILEMEGFLEAIPRVGYQVKEILWSEVDDICEIRKVNETLAACWAMNRISPQELNMLQQNVDEAEAAVKGGNPRRFIDLDVDFHNILMRASQSRQLAEICQTIRRHMVRYRIESSYDAGMVLISVDGHRRILDRLKAHDVAGITQAINDHLDHVKLEIQKGRTFLAGYHQTDDR